MSAHFAATAASFDSYQRIREAAWGLANTIQAIATPMHRGMVQKGQVGDCELRQAPFAQMFQVLHMVSASQYVVQFYSVPNRYPSDEAKAQILPCADYQAYWPYSAGTKEQLCRNKPKQAAGIPAGAASRVLEPNCRCIRNSKGPETLAVLAVPMSLEQLSCLIYLPGRVATSKPVSFLSDIGGRVTFFGSANRPFWVLKLLERAVNAAQRQPHHEAKLGFARQGSDPWCQDTPSYVA
ncbi:hypothetical protein QBC46DRAFT_411206 [Diplogelasinospora grovesii]|uniref:Uncharacterized protein n=1 Tax=Diplogelasinospora grovesii TaxID=303347 RepID=A0AAN6N3X2_9PEZI|nr:hypothetical protein QBC46DRAFT_411206 [Diplogelasinospora grovesii]